MPATGELTKQADMEFLLGIHAKRKLSRGRISYRTHLLVTRLLMIAIPKRIRLVGYIR